VRPFLQQRQAPLGIVEDDLPRHLATVTETAGPLHHWFKVRVSRVQLFPCIDVDGERQRLQETVDEHGEAHVYNITNEAIPPT
jgi:hypothetical protein